MLFETVKIDILEQVVGTANEKGVSYRTAAFINAFESMQENYKDSGFTI